MPSTSFTSSDGNAFEWLTLSRSCERSGRDAAVRSARRASARGGSHGHVVGTLQRARATRKHHLLRQRRREGAQHHASSTATRREVRHVCLHRWRFARKSCTIAPKAHSTTPPLSFTRPRTHLSLPQKRARDRRKIVARPPPHLTRIPLRRRGGRHALLALLPLERLAGRPSGITTSR